MNKLLNLVVFCRKLSLFVGHKAFDALYTVIGTVCFMGDGCLPGIYTSLRESKYKEDCRYDRFRIIVFGNSNINSGNSFDNSVIEAICFSGLQI